MRTLTDLERQFLSCAAESPPSDPDADTRPNFGEELRDALLNRGWIAWAPVSEEWDTLVITDMGRLALRVDTWVREGRN